MNEEAKRRGRPPKNHLQDEHHFRALDESNVENVTLAVTELQEVVVENPIQPTFLTQRESLIVESGNTSEPLIVPANHNQQYTNYLAEESPVEEKIHVLVEQQRVFLGEPSFVEISQLNGWHPITELDTVVTLPPRNGNPVCLTQSLDSKGVIAFWKRERAFANATKRWQEHGVWRDFNTGMKIDFEPKYWKERF